MAFATRWHAVQRVGLTEEECEYLEILQAQLGLRYPHQVLRVILTQHFEKPEIRRIVAGLRGPRPKRSRSQVGT